MEEIPSDIASSGETDSSTEPAEWSGIVTPERKEAILGLNLCDLDVILTPKQQEELARDLASLAVARRYRPPEFYTDRLD